MNIKDLTERAAQIMGQYSAGTLPMPGYVTVSDTGNGSIRFQMSSPADVRRWAKSVDATTHAHPWKDENGKRTVHHTVGFKDGEVQVEVYHVEH